MPNYMRELDLPLEPAPSLEQIQGKIEEKCAAIKRQANAGLMDMETKNRRLHEYEALQNVMNDPVQRKNAIEEEFRQAVDSVRRTALLMQQAGICAYQQADVTQLADRLRIQADTVARVFQENGLHEENGTPAPVAIPRRYDQENNIHDHIDSLCEQVQDARNSVTDLYDFLAYYSANRTNHAISKAELMHMDRKSLHLLAEQWARDCALNGNYTIITTILSNLLADCNLMLSSDENQQAYHVSLQYETCQALRDLDEMHVDRLYTEPNFADQSIREIARHFHVDENVALAIYNQKIRPRSYTPQAPYRPTIQCPNCNALIRVNDENGQRVTLCPECNEQLYVRCRCGITVQAIAERCPSCGRRIHAMRYIPEYAERAKQLIQDGKFGLAEHFVNQIELLDDRAEQLPGLREALRGFAKRQAPLHRLCDARQYYAAKALLRKNPDLAEGFLRANEIDEQIARAEDRKNRYQRNGAGLTEAQAYEILQICADTPDVRMPPPRPARNVQAQYNMAQKAVAISWDNSESARLSRIVYDVYRQTGKEKPRIIGAGRIARELHATNYVDQNAPPGQNVWYYVVARRDNESSGICSIESAIRVMHEFDDATLSITPQDQQIRFDWTIPSGAQGIRMISDGRDMNISPGATSAIVRGVPGQQIQFVFQALYEIDGVRYCTPGITHYVAPTSLRPLQITIDEYNGRVKARWDRQPENARMEFILTSREYAIGDTVSEQDIRANAINGNVYAAQARDGECDLGTIPMGNYQIVGFIYLAGAFKACSPVPYSNTPAINTQGLTYDTAFGNRVILRNIRLPVNASGIVAFLNETVIHDTNSPKQADMTAQELSDNQNSLNLEGLQEGHNNYITLYAYYNVNQDRVYSKPSIIPINASQRRTIECSLEWDYKKTGPILRRTSVLVGATLRIRMPSECEYCPEMKLVGTAGALPPRSIADGQMLMTVSEVEEDDYSELFARNERVIRFKATSDGEGIRLSPVDQPAGICMMPHPLGRRYQLAMFVTNDMGFQIRSTGQWFVP